MTCPCLSKASLGSVSDLFATSWTALKNLINNYKAGTINWDQLQSGLTEVYEATWNTLSSEEIVMLRIAVADYLEEKGISATVTRTKAQEYATKWGLNYSTLQTRAREEIDSLNRTVSTTTTAATTTLTTISNSSGIYWVLGLSLGAVGLYFLVRYLSNKKEKKE